MAEKIDTESPLPYHIPVLLNESIEALQINPEGIYLDLTFGGGGHSRRIVEQLKGKGKLFAFDQDADVLANAPELIQHPHFQLIAANFRYMQKYLSLYQISQVDGILADLGISSHQIDTPNRGFSIRYNHQLDMRMNQSQQNDAYQIVNQYTEKELQAIFFRYGELRNARGIAHAIIKKRTQQDIITTFDLKETLKTCAPKGTENQFFAQVFQALRIEVNEELKALEEMLLQCPELLKKKARIAIITYHSLEDRLVKNFFLKGNLEGDLQKDFYGNPILALQSINRKPILPTEAEIKANTRARSAKLRVAEKI